MNFRLSFLEKTVAIFLVFTVSFLFIQCVEAGPIGVSSWDHPVSWTFEGIVMCVAAVMCITAISCRASAYSLGALEKGALIEPWNSEPFDLFPIHGAAKKLMKKKKYQKAIDTCNYGITKVPFSLEKYSDNVFLAHLYFIIAYASLILNDKQTVENQVVKLKDLKNNEINFPYGAHNLEEKPKATADRNLLVDDMTFILTYELQQNDVLPDLKYKRYFAITGEYDKSVYPRRSLSSIEFLEFFAPEFSDGFWMTRDEDPAQ